MSTEKRIVGLYAMRVLVLIALVVLIFGSAVWMEARICTRINGLASNLEVSPEVPTPSQHVGRYRFLSVSDRSGAEQVVVGDSVTGLAFVFDPSRSRRFSPNAPQKGLAEETIRRLGIASDSTNAAQRTMTTDQLLLITRNAFPHLSSMTDDELINYVLDVSPWLRNHLTETQQK